MIQGSDEWFAARLGKLTASRIALALATTETGWGASRANVRAELVCERLTGLASKGYVNAEMQWGTDHEAEARDAYEFYRDVDVELVGFVDHPRIAMSGASPDGHIGTDGGLEIKCPNTATHIETLLGAPVDGRYVKQVQWQMACSGRKWTDFVSYDPRMPSEMQMHIQRIPRDDKMIAQMEADAELFLREVETTVAALLGKFGIREAA
jgi:putative phage-type endonuclease